MWEEGCGLGEDRHQDYKWIARKQMGSGECGHKKMKKKSWKSRGKVVGKYYNIICNNP